MAKLTNEVDVARTEESFFTHLLTHREHRPATAGWLDAIGARAAQRIPAIPAPGPRDEEWRFINIRPLLRTDFVPFYRNTDQVSADDLRAYHVPEADGARITFVNGQYSEGLSSVDSLPEGVVLSHMAGLTGGQLEIPEKEFGRHHNMEDDPFQAINTALLHDGAFVYVPDHVVLERPIHLQFVSTDGDAPWFGAPRCLIVGGRFSSFTVIEDYVGLGSETYLNSPVVEIHLGENSHLLHTRIQRESPNAYHVGRVGATLQRSSNYESYSIHLGSKLSRNDVISVLAGQEINCTLDGLVLIHEDQVSDTHTMMDHRKPYCTSHQLHKTIVDDRAHSIFNGKIYVRQDAQKTDSFQENRNLLLSADGTVNTKPQLEIFADDVKCSHGATIGQFELDELFYLQSRGLSEEASRQLLAYGFALDIIQNIPVDSVQQQLSNAVSKFANRSEEVQDPA